MEIKNLLLDLIFPRKCVACNLNLKNKEVLCWSCQKEIKINSTLFCGACLARLPQNKKICHKDFPYLLGAATSYQDEIIKKLILALKFKGVQKAAEFLGNVLVGYAENTMEPFWNYLVVPIPLSSRRLRERGFNQAELIAKVFADHFNLKLETQNLTRLKDTKPQSGLKGMEKRALNVRDAFIIKKPEFFEGQSIILIDDVVTSEATLKEAVLALKKAGAKKILTLVVAKA